MLGQEDFVVETLTENKEVQNIFNRFKIPLVGTVAGETGNFQSHQIFLGYLWNMRIPFDEYKNGSEKVRSEMVVAFYKYQKAVEEASKKKFKGCIFLMLLSSLLLTLYFQFQFRQFKMMLLMCCPLK